MIIVVTVKQVPETGSVKMDPEAGTMIRAGVSAVVNPLDLYAIETALRIREEHGGTVTAITMGPPPAVKVVKEAVAMGCDDGVLVTDHHFAGSDTWATSYTLAAAIRAIGPCDLIVCGERATDGDTAQVGPGIAAWMDVPVVTYVSLMNAINDESITVERLTEEGYQRVRVTLPALITTVKEIGSPRLPTLRGKKRSRQLDIRILAAEDLDVDETRLGLKGSPTKVVKIDSPRVTRNGERHATGGPDGVPKAVEKLVQFLDARGILSGSGR